MSRKTRRDLVRALAAALLGGLLPACTHTAARVATAGPPVAMAQPAAADVESPYHSLAPPASSQNDPAKRAEPRADMGSRNMLPTVVPPDPVPLAVAPPDRAPPRATLEKPEGDVLPDRLPGPAPPAQVEARSPTEPTQPPLVEALRWFLDNRPSAALESLKAYDQANQELLLLLLPLSARLTEGSVQKANPQEVGYFMEQLDGVVVTLRPRAALVIDKMCFCEDIKAFGVYEPTAEKPTYRPGDWAKVYIEVRNFSSQKRDDAPGQTIYATSLESSVEILDGRRQKVWPRVPHGFVLHRVGPDKSRTLRHDYFDTCEFKVPELPPGSYTLWIQVEDLATRRTARRSLDFDVRYPGL